MLQVGDKIEEKSNRTGAVLGVRMRFENYGILTRKEWLERIKADGGISEIGTKSRIQFNRRKFNRMTIYAEQEEYERKCNEEVPDYRIYAKQGERSFWSITKIEYDYFNTLT